MPNLTGKQVLDLVLTKIHDNSPEMRERLIAWLPLVMNATLAEREWNFCPDLKKTVQVVIAENVVVLPADFEEVISITIGTDFFFDQSGILSGKEAFRLSSLADTTPQGFQVEGLILTFFPGAEGTATVKYQPSLSAVVDDDTPTPWPDEFLGLFVRSLLTGVYEYDLHPGISFSAALDVDELMRVKMIDNRREVMPTYSPRGYLRECE
jgi:hypothetical protein